MFAAIRQRVAKKNVAPSAEPLPKAMGILVLGEVAMKKFIILIAVAIALALTASPEIALTVSPSAALADGCVGPTC